MTESRNLNILFWNLAQNAGLARSVALLAKTSSTDIIFLAECKINEVELVQELSKVTGRVFLRATPFASSIQAFHSLGRDRVRPIETSKRVNAIELTDYGGSSFLLMGAHLPSKLHSDDYDGFQKGSLFKREIENIEDRVDCRNTIVIGDLNMNPYERGVVSIEGLNSLMDQKVVSRPIRRVEGRPSRLFYNPMWSLLGDRSSGPSGSYYRSSGNNSTCWQMLDQVLVRPEVLEKVSLEKVEILDRIGTTSLLSINLIPDKRRYSDHLPLIVNFTLLNKDIEDE